MAEYQENPNYEEAFLLTAADIMEANIIEALLKANDIPVLKKYRGNGAYLKIVMGGTVFGVDMYVPKQLLERASELVKESREASLDDDFPYNVIAEEASLSDSTQTEETTENKQTESDNTQLTGNQQSIVEKRPYALWITILFLIPGLLWLIIMLIKSIFSR